MKKLIVWQKNTVKTSEFNCSKYKEKLGIGKVAIVLICGKSSRLCEKCGNKSEGVE